MLRKEYGKYSIHPTRDASEWCIVSRIRGRGGRIPNPNLAAMRHHRSVIAAAAIISRIALTPHAVWLRLFIYAFAIAHN